MNCPRCNQQISDEVNFCSSCGSAQKEATVYAGFWIRFLGVIIDYIVIFVALVMVGFINSSLQRFSSGNEFILYNIASYVYLIVIPWLYYALMESSSYQGTIGKRIFGLKVKDLNDQRISFGKSTGRFFSRLVSILLFNLGFLIAAFTNKKQTLHDIMSGCVVLKSSSYSKSSFKAL